MNLDWERWAPKFWIFTDHPQYFPHQLLDGVEKAIEIQTVDVRPFLAEAVLPPSGVPGRWACMSMFNPNLHDPLGGEPLLYTDVDNAIIGNLTPLVEEAIDQEFSCHRDWGNAMEWNWLASGFLGIRPGGTVANFIWQYFREEGPRYTEFLFQGLLQRAIEANNLESRAHKVPDPMVASYKRLTGMMPAHGAGQVGTWDEAIILCFHGKPKPDEVIAGRMEGWERGAKNWTGDLKAVPAVV